MIPIFPIDQENCRPHYGRLVCAVMSDGSRHVGILSRLTNGRVILNDFSGDAKSSKTKRKKAAVKAKAGRNDSPTLDGPTIGPTGMDSFSPYSIAPGPFLNVPDSSSASVGTIRLNVSDIEMLFLIID